MTASAGTDAQAPAPRPLARLAVTGLGARLGALSGTGALHRAARPGRSALTERPPHRWYGADGLTRGPLSGTPAQDSAVPGGYLDRIDVHPRVYRIPPNELAQANPQHLALFEAAEQALTDAGYPAPPPGTKADELPERRVGVVVAMEMEPRTHTHRARFDIGAHVRAECERAGVRLGREELDRLEEAVRGAVHEPIGANEVLSYIGNIMASRLSSSRNLTGPSFTVAADGTAGVRALEVAGLLLLDPTVEAVLVGGVDLAAGAENTWARARLAARDGQEPPPLGDGAAAVVVTRAGETGRKVYATVDALRVHSGDGGQGHGPAVAAAARAALADARVSPGDVEYLELGGATPAARHGEAAALATVYRPDPQAAREADAGDPYGCVLGSTGALVGDTQRAAPLAALVAAALVLHHADFPAAPDGLLPDPEDTAFEGSCFTVLGEPQPWPVRRRGAARVAALSLLGDTGPARRHSRPRGAARDTAGHRPGTARRRLARRPRRAAAAAHRRRRPRAGRRGPRRRRRTRRARTAGGDPPGRTGAGRPPLPPHRRPGRPPTPQWLAGELAAAERDLPRVIAEGGEWSTPSGSYCTARPMGPDGRVAFVYPGAFTTYPGA
ncbi:hypothetical protein LUW77_28320 [Streptomyces radiopugnans]|nr:hypothetical protein LUW77_28320 [Streptomyces radiopugnans]